MDQLLMKILSWKTLLCMKRIIVWTMVAIHSPFPIPIEMAFVVAMAKAISRDIFMETSPLTLKEETLAPQLQKHFAE